MDDDLLLNFAPADSLPAKRAPKRRREDGDASKHARKRISSAPSVQQVQTDQRDAVAAAKAAARAAAARSEARAQNETSAKPLNKVSRGAAQGPQEGPVAGKNYISSLFARDERSRDEPAPAPAPSTAAPTNAPAADADFESLGLDRLIAAHLAERMQVLRPTEIQRAVIPPLVAAPPAALAARDVLMQAQTGSGKTLAYLLPVIQSLLPLSHESFIDRTVGTLAIILAPTRELARQIHQVLEKLLTLSLTTHGEGGKRYARWIVPGLLTGGSTKNHEKQRLRKGCTVLVATPGRLLDHLQNTSSFDVGKCRWLILDEADRLLEMGFEEQLNGIVKALDGRRRLACGIARDAMVAAGTAEGDVPDAEVADSLGISWWAWRRRTVLCSATLDERVQMFSGTTLNHPLVVRAGGGGGSIGGGVASGSADDARQGGGSDDDDGDDDDDVDDEGKDTTGASKRNEPTQFSAPAQLQQHVVVVPPKLRLVTVIALLRSAIRHGQRADGTPTRVIVFLTCTDSVDFHWHALGGARLSASPAESKDADEKAPDTPKLAQYSELLGAVPIYRLHGSMTQKERIASLRAFRELSDGSAERSEPPRGGVLLCTAVASRGLDLPDVKCVVQMDVPTEGGVEEYIHRAGRTARAGQAGTSWLMLLPHEKPWLDTLRSRMVVAAPAGSSSSSSSSGSNGVRPARVEVVAYDTVLFQGFGGAAREFESRATDVQMATERWVLKEPANATLARTAFLAHVRAYATHPASEKALFNIHQLHLGHMAKAFALREAPNTVQKTSKKEHDRAEGITKDKKDKKEASRERQRRMMANLPTESL
ncbi:RNA helicase [Malassezia cuniculi]|uniref:ATP-dependent RNA helicase n=1 Tax=Malassezia cuniculi TaxID=948313 RepID=A0AAF0EZ41_9BASI|nr:RNA helicase [Malassezia cuniculi]